MTVMSLLANAVNALGVLTFDVDTVPMKLFFFSLVYQESLRFQMQLQICR